MKLLLGTILGFVVTRALDLLAPSGAGLGVSNMLLFVGGVVAGYVAQRKGWIAGLLVGLLDAIVNIAVLASIGRSVGLPVSFSYAPFLSGVMNCLMALPCGTIGGFIGGGIFTRCQSK